MTKGLKSTNLHSTRVLISKKKKHRVVRTISSSEVGKIIAINEGFCLFKMMRCRRRQGIDPQKLKKIVNGRFFCFLLVEAEAETIGVEAEAVEKYPLPHPWSCDCAFSTLRLG